LRLQRQNLWLALAEVEAMAAKHPGKHMGDSLLATYERGDRHPSVLRLRPDSIYGIDIHELLPDASARRPSSAAVTYERSPTPWRALRNRHGDCNSPCSVKTRRAA